MKTTVAKIAKWTGIVVLAVVVTGVGAGIWWGTHPLGPSASALAALHSDSSLRVTKASDGWEFAPATGAEPTSALVFYPGGHVDARSYAPYARAVAARGYLVVVPVMPLSLAVIAPNAADTAISAHPAVTNWSIGGHSLGGAMAARYAARHPGAVRGLVLLASYAPNGDDLAHTDVVALTQVGTLDTVINRANLEASRALLPASATLTELQGGNHAQFGDYGLQPGDTPNPTMSASEQRAAAVSGTVDVMSRAGSRR